VICARWAVEKRLDRSRSLGPPNHLGNVRSRMIKLDPLNFKSSYTCFACTWLTPSILDSSCAFSYRLALSRIAITFSLVCYLALPLWCSVLSLCMSVSQLTFTLYSCALSFKPGWYPLSKEENDAKLLRCLVSSWTLRVEPKSWIHAFINNPSRCG